MASLPLGPQTHHHHHPPPPHPPEHDPLKLPFRRPDQLDSEKVLHSSTSLSTSDRRRSASLSFGFLNSRPISLFSPVLTRSRSEHCLRDSPLERFSDPMFLFLFLSQNFPWILVLWCKYWCCGLFLWVWRYFFSPLFGCCVNLGKMEGKWILDLLFSTSCIFIFGWLGLAETRCFASQIQKNVNFKNFRFSFSRFYVLRFFCLFLLWQLSALGFVYFCALVLVRTLILSFVDLFVITCLEIRKVLAAYF